MERAEHLDTQHIRGVALTIRATVAAHQGRAADARADARAALQIAIECDTPQLALRATTILGFVDVSMANYEDAHDGPAAAHRRVRHLPGAEIRNRDYVPDAIEALINVGQIAEAEPLIERLEADGQRLDRPWNLAVGARSRAMWWAAKGDLDEAMHAITMAMARARPPRDAVRAGAHAAAARTAAAPQANEGRSRRDVLGRRCACSRRWARRCGQRGPATRSSARTSTRRTVP